ncbi:MAG: PilZ domain-containing protein [Beijerinckiaceae bacterium]|nr:PilZ domain-containing protein [Beijerinckiaceae bacterium]
MISARQSALTTVSAPHEDRRRHARLKISLFGKYMLTDRRELPCQTIDVSAGGLALAAPVIGHIGQRVVVYLEHLGRLEGDIVRPLKDGFAIQLRLSPLKRDKIADTLTWLVNRSELGLREDRRHERIEPIHKRVQVQLGDGSVHPGMLVDVSLSGAYVKCGIQPNFGETVTIGSTQGRVVRRSADGFAIEFLRLLPLDTFDNRAKL